LPNLAVPTPAYESAGNFITGALWNANVYNGLTYLLNPPMFDLYSSVAQGIPNTTFQALGFDTNRIDTYTGHSTTSNNTRYTCQAAGYYWVHGQCSWAANATGVRALELAKNGTAIIDTEDLQQTANLAGQTQHVMGIVQLAAGDYLELWAYQSSGAALSTSSSGNWQPNLSGFWLHA
jgi:hypothetical protein